MKQDNELGLRISAKYNRIYVHRTTLKAIGNPEFVSLGIHPKSKKLVVLAAEECDKEAMRVRYTEDNVFCIYSMSTFIVQHQKPTWSPSGLLKA